MESSLAIPAMTIRFIAAIAQAKATLAEMASDNIPLQAGDVLSVSDRENVRRDTVATMRLVLQIEFPNKRRSSADP